MGLPFTLLSLAFAILSPSTSASSTTRNPIGALSAVQNATIHTHNHRLTALSEFDLSFNIRDDVFVKLHLEPNPDILPHDASVTYLNSDGSLLRKESVNRLEHKVYKGNAWVQRPRIGHDQWIRVGWARVTVDRDGRDPVFSGAFSVDHDHHHIQTSTNYMRTKHRLDPDVTVEPGYLVIWRDSDILPDQQGHQELRRSIEDAGTCFSDQLGFNSAPDHPVFMAMAKRSERSYGYMDFSNIFKRQVDSTTGGNSAGTNLVSTIGQTAGCPTTRKVALVGVATDCTYTADFDSEQLARANVIDQMNTASGIWENTFNISFGLQNLTMLSAACPGTPPADTEWNQPCSNSVTITDRLNYFSAWRGNQKDDNNHWTLLSTCATESAVGLAWLGQACVGTAYTTNGTSLTGNGQSNSGTSETVTGANVVIRTSGAAEWQIIAHETGHTFGAVHDCTSQTCAEANVVNSQQCCQLSANTCDANDKYIMNPYTTTGINSFSPCTVGNICGALLRNSVSSQCLTDNKGVTTITGQQCGNGIVEGEEECDCGGTEGCTDDPCCDPTTCKYTSGSVCDDSNEDCCHNCQFASNGTVCRASTGQCDPQEVCPGTSGSCPADQTTADGTGCGSGLQCASGQCTSRDQQCKTVMGSYTQGNDTYACNSQDCAISCGSPEFGSGVCYGLQQNFLDGTECGGGGRCSNGQCKGSSFGGEVKSWIDDHKTIVIVLCSVIGGLLLLSLLGCLIRCCKRGRSKQRVPSPAVPPPGGWQGWNDGGRGPPMQQERNNFYAPQQQHPSQGWFDQAGSRGAQQWQPPPVPPPAFQPRSSVRYA